MLRSMACAGLAATILVVFTPEVAHSATPVLPALGINVDATAYSWTTYEQEDSLYHAAGATWTRIAISWDNLEPTEGNVATWYLHRIDGAITHAQAHGMSTLLTVFLTPAWARPQSTNPAAAPQSPTSYSWIMSYLANRYKGLPVAFEIWNEPDEASSFAGGSPSEYVSMACYAYRAIKAANPAAKVVGGVVAGEDIIWLRQAFADGLGPCIDVLSEHPYSTQSSLSFDMSPTWQPKLITGQVHALMAQHGDGAKPIWFTEVGYSAVASGADLGYAGEVSLTGQGDLMVALAREVEADYPYVQKIMFYRSKDLDDGLDAYQEDFGILTDTLTPKPSYYALKDLYVG